MKHNQVNFNEISVHKAPERSPGFLLWQVSTTWRGAIETTLGEMGLTHPQFVILATLGWLTRDGERVTQKSVGNMVGLDPNTTSQVIRGLEKKALITRVQSVDRRAKNPILTPQGAQLLKIALPAVEATDAEFFQQLTQEELETLLRIFQKLSTGIKSNSSLQSF